MIAGTGYIFYLVSTKFFAATHTSNRFSYVSLWELKHPWSKQGILRTRVCVIIICYFFFHHSVFPHFFEVHKMIYKMQERRGKGATRRP
ncbi:hypothetical protein EDC01DRAFT_674655 [Geopyxis carbonaria]|nr:hypothetical protein EDC01DRAFT_674655 [Geopyxis carbonaria]